MRVKRRWLWVSLVGFLLILFGTALVTQSVNAPQFVNLPAIPEKVHPPPILASRSNLPVAETFELTAYTSGPESTGKSPGDPAYSLAANGKPIQEGEVACDSHYPFGTRFRVDGFGTLVCTDRGGAIIGHHLDIYMPDLNKALQFGKQFRKVVIER